MITHPRIRAKYQVETIANEGIFLLAENERHLLEGPGIMAVAPLLDGRLSWDEIMVLTAGHVGADNVRSAFEVLQTHGHVEQADPLMPDELHIFWRELGRDAAAARGIVGSCNLHIQSFGNVDAEPLRRSAALFGFPLQADRPASLTIAVADNLRSPALRTLNRMAMAHGTPWVLVKPHGLTPLIGPFFLPGRTPCWACLESRVRHNSEIETYVERKLGLQQPITTTRARIPLADAQVASITLLQIARWLATGQNPTMEGRITALNIVTGEQAHHGLVRRPQCPDCGDPAAAWVAGRELALQSRTMTDRGENGLRAEPPGVTFLRYAHHVSDITGVVKHVVPSYWNGVGPLKSYVAGHNFALNTGHIRFLQSGLRQVSSGKGKTDEQARTSALCEALERYCGLWRGEEEARVASLEELGGDGVDPTTVTLFSDRQYTEREAWLARGEQFQVVPHRFDPKARISWSPLWSLTRGRRVWLPSSMLYFGFNDADGRFFFWGDSNGNAGGSTLEDAILQGFLELVERDAVAIWWYNRLRRRQVDLSTLRDPFIDDLRIFYQSHQREFWLLDLTSDLGIPAFAAINRRMTGPTEDIIMGFGAHLDGRIGIMRALTEMNQFVPGVLARNPDGSTAYGLDDPACLRWWKTARLADEPYLQPLEEPPIPIDELPVAKGGDVLAHIGVCRDRVERLGHEVLVLDQTRPDVGLPVAKVIVPGLRHFWARFAPGRLYDVPVRMGWLERPLGEDELNPTPMFV